MIGLIDPALFINSNKTNIKNDIDSIIMSCAQHNIRIIPFQSYWPKLWQTLGQSLEQQLSPIERKSLIELRKLGIKNINQPRLTPDSPGIAWRNGFSFLFSDAHLNHSWENEMASAIIEASILDDKVILFTRLVEGRNLEILQADNCTLNKITRWVLHVQPPGLGHRQILCVHHPRNLVEPWTCRFDWRLPGDSDLAKFPFSPPPKWWKGSVTAIRTIASKPAWIDDKHNGWIRPNINAGSGYHWDVIITSPLLQATLGLNHLNIVEHGAPTSQGIQGTVHHTPKAMTGKLKQDHW